METLVTVGLLILSMSTQTAAHDAAWWRALDADQRTELWTGYTQYYTWKLRGPVMFTEPPDEYRERLDARLTANASDCARPIGDLIEEEARRAAVAGPAPRGLTGQYWTELSDTGRL